jgi:hypothetical protein
MKKILLLNGLVCLVLIVCCGCASIVDGGRKKVKLNSNPSGATVTVSDEQGQTIVTNTPAVVRLDRFEGYFKGKKYTVKFELPGYYPSELQINPTLNPWYFGNILFGGVIGIAIVDPLTGAMWTLNPRKVDWNLIPTSRNLSPDELKAAEAEANPMDKKKVETTKGSVK